jgi:Tol biopolymer transport system component
MIVYAYHGDLWARDSLTAVDRILVGGAGDQAYPLFSPDGRRLAFSTTIDRKELLMVSDADGSHVHQLLPDPLLGVSLAWSSDSSSLLVVNEVAGRPSLFVVPIDGSPARRLDLGDLVPAEASWQPPDGRLILFHGLRLDGSVDLYTVQPDGSGLHPLGLAARSAYGTRYTLSGATWAPDGRSILVNAVGLDGSGPAERFRVASVAADGTHWRILPGPADPKVQEAWPVVSPDGRWILVHRWTWKADNGGQGWLAVMPSDGSGPAVDIGPRIPGGEDTGLAKTWSPDGTRVLMASANTTQVFSIDPVTGLQDPLDWADQLPDWQRVSR